MDENSAEIEYLMNRNNNGVYAKVKGLQYEPSTRSNTVKDKEGKIVFDNEKVAIRWKEYMEELYLGLEITNEDQYIENEEEVNNNMKGPPMDEDEFNKSLKDLSDKKATDVDGISSGILKSLDDKTKNPYLNSFPTLMNTVVFPRISSIVEPSQYPKKEMLRNAQIIKQFCSLTLLKFF